MVGRLLIVILIKQLGANCSITTYNYEFKAIEGDGQFLKCKKNFKLEKQFNH